MSAFRNSVFGVKSWVYAILIISFSIFSFSPAPETYLFYKLDFTVKQPVARPDLETQMLRMINEERIKQGLIPLAPDPAMTEIAREHSRDMFMRGYFSHYTPEKSSPYDRMKGSNITYMKAGENISLAQTVEKSHHNLMESKGHRENILRPNFGRLGIGIMDGGEYGLMVTQDFRN